MNPVKHKLKHFFSIFLITLIFIMLFSGCIESKTDIEKEPKNFEFSKRYKVEVLEIIDGDTIDVEFQNGSKGRIRFLGIDTPETNQNYNHKNEYRNITDLKCLTNWSLKAKNYTTQHLKDKTIYIGFDEEAGFKGGYGRWLSYIYLINGTDFNKMILKNGYARVYTSEDFSKKEQYIELQNNAINKNKGLWNCN